MRTMILVKDSNTLGLHCKGYKDLISNSLIQYIQENTINSIMISYHAPVSLSINTQAHTTPPTRWRFNTSHMEGPDFNSMIKREWSSFLEINDSPEILPSLLWETGKALMRRKIISYSSYKKKRQQELHYNYTKSLGSVVNSHGFSYHCYADDTQLFLSFPPSATQINEKISACLADISSWMARYHLKLNLDKTEQLYIPNKTSPLLELSVTVDGTTVTASHSARNLGVVLDDKITN